MRPSSYLPFWSCRTPSPSSSPSSSSPPASSASPAWPKSWRLYLLFRSDSLRLGVELLPLRHEDQLASLCVLLQGLAIKFPPAAFGAEYEVVLALGRKRLLELLLADGLLLVGDDLLLLSFFNFLLSGFLNLLGLLLLRGGFLLLDLLSGWLFGDEYSFLHGDLGRLVDGLLFLHVGVLVEDELQRGLALLLHRHFLDRAHPLRILHHVIGDEF